MSGVLRWEDPPPVAVRHQGQRVTAWAVIAYQLRERPGEWAVVYEGSRDMTAVARIKSGKSWFAPAGSFEAVHRRLPTGGEAIYARYIGEPS